MGLIMLILIGVVPTAYALNRALSRAKSLPFLKTSTSRLADARSEAGSASRRPPTRATVGDYVADASVPACRDARPRPVVPEHQGPGRGATARCVCCLRRPCRTSATTCISLAEAIRSIRQGRCGQADARRRRSMLNGYRSELDDATRVHSGVGQGRRSRSRSASARWSAGSGSSSPWERKSARAISPMPRARRLNSSPRRRLRRRTCGDCRCRPRRCSRPGVAGTMAAGGSGPAGVDGAQHADGVGARAAGGDRVVRHAVLAVPQGLLTRVRSRVARLLRESAGDVRLTR